MTLSGANTATATFTAPTVAEGTCGVLTFELKVTDPCGAMTTDTVVVNVSDRFILQDDRNGNCLRLDACQGDVCVQDRQRSDVHRAGGDHAKWNGSPLPERAG